MRERLQVGTETRSTLQILTPFQALKAAFPILILALLEVRGAKTEAALFIMFC